MGKILLSKSKLKSNKQCVKRLWLEVHRPKLAVWDKKDLASFSRGRDVEKIARDNFKPSVEITSWKNEEKVTKTTSLLVKENNILEASFKANDVIVQVDILSKNPDVTWNAVEIKSGSSLKDDYIDDVIIQYWTIVESKQVEIKKFELWYINRQATGEKDLFEKVDVTERVIASKDLYDKWVKESHETAALEEEPQVDIGPHCSNPNSCPFKKYCWRYMESPKSVLNLPGFSSKYKAHNSKIYFIDDPRFEKEYKNYIDENPIVMKSILTNSLVIDFPKMKELLDKWIFPLKFFDFETLTTAVPLLQGSHPYEQVVFQYSLHEMAVGSSKLSHKEFLHENLMNPAIPLINRLINDLGTTGSIVSFSKSFEISRINELALNCPDPVKKDQLLALVPRFVDLMDVVKECIYHPDFMGSYSLKIVSPTLLGKENGGYTDSEIQGGGEISQYYTSFLLTTHILRRIKMKQSLIKYCKYDTLNLYLLYMWMSQELNQSGLNLNNSSFEDKK